MSSLNSSALLKAHLINRFVNVNGLFVLKEKVNIGTQILSKRFRFTYTKENVFNEAILLQKREFQKRNLKFKIHKENASK